MDHPPWRPICEPARTIHDAVWNAPPGRTVDAAWLAVRDFAQKHGAPVPTIRQVEEAAITARCHTDYSAKFAYNVAALLPENIGL